MIQQNKAVFLDRDGVLNKTIIKMGKPRAPYSQEEFELFDGVGDAIKILKEAGYILVVVTNQPDVSRGWVSREQVDLINNLVLNRLKLDKIYCCFHDNFDSCLCRKPMPGMLLEGASDFNISMNDSFMIGDRCTDVEAGQKAGCRTFLVGEDTECLKNIDPTYKVQSLLEAALIIHGL